MVRILVRRFRTADPGAGIRNRGCLLTVESFRYDDDDDDLTASEGAILEHYSYTLGQKTPIEGNFNNHDVHPISILIPVK